MANFFTYFTRDKFNYWLLYYIFLGIVQAMWTNLNAFPPMPLRLGMTIAVFMPMIFRKDLVVFGFPFFLILRSQLSTAYQYLPDSNSYLFYIAVLLFLILIHWRSIESLDLKYYIPVIILIIYIGVIDLIGNAEFGTYAINLFIVILYSLFLEKKHDLDILSSSLIFVCAISAIYYIIMYDQFLVSWNSAEGIERSGWKDPNYFSTFMNVGFMLSLLYAYGFLKSTIVLLNKRILIAVCLLITMAVVLTASRAGFFSLVLILIIISFSAKLNYKVLIAGLVTVIVAGLFMYFTGMFDTLIFRIFEQGNLETGGDRTTIWAKGIKNFEIQPYIMQLFGAGYWHRTELTGGNETHNEFIAILLDYGIIGLMLFLYMIINMFSFRRCTISRIRNISTVLYLLCVVSLSPFQYVNIGFLILWILNLKKLEYQINK